MSNVVTTADFDSTVMRSDKPVLVDFWAEWCPPCRMLSPVVDSLAKEMAAELTVAKLDTDANPEVASRFEIMGIPTLILFRGGKEVARFVGYQPLGTLRGNVKTALTKG
jgi:thioredoxin 1